MRKKANVQMVLLTSVTRRDYLENGTLNPDILGDYPKAMRAFAEKHHIPLLDVFSRSQELFQTFSKEETKNSTCILCLILVKITQKD